MAITRYTLPNFEVFTGGIIAKSYDIPEKGQYQDNKVSDFEQIQQPESDKYELSYLGTKVFSWVQLGHTNTSLNSYLNENGNTINYEALKINEVLLTVTQNKNIVKTQVAGRSGTVKEYISSGDYGVQIQGFLIDPNPQKRPDFKIQQLLQICEASASIKVFSNFLNLFGISDLVIESYSLPQKAGFWNVQPFELNCVSDVPFELVKE